VRQMLKILIAGILLSGAMAPNAIAELKDWRQEECKFQGVERGIWTAREERLTSICVLQKWSVPGGYSKFYDVGDCESGWWRFSNNDGRYLGLFQHSSYYWSTRVANMEPVGWHLSRKWTNSRTQIVVTARMVHSGGWGPWTCA